VVVDVSWSALCSCRKLLPWVYFPPCSLVYSRSNNSLSKTALLTPGTLILDPVPACRNTFTNYCRPILTGLCSTIALKDSTGATAYSDIVTVNGGTDSSCLNASVSGTSTGGSGAAATGSSTSGAAAATGTASHSSGSATSTASSSSSTQSSAAGRLSVSSAFGVAGIMGFVGASLF